MNFSRVVLQLDRLVLFPDLTSIAEGDHDMEYWQPRGRTKRIHLFENIQPSNGYGHRKSDYCASHRMTFT